MAKPNLQMGFPYNLLCKVSLGSLEVKNGELIQNIIVKETILFWLIKKLFGVKKNG